jgi:hypothetical protein
MRVLIATNELQGTRPDDYTWTVEGELVTPVVAECSSGDRCGCARGFPGLASERATTTAMVVERAHMTMAALRDAIEDYLDRGGWIELFVQQAIDHGHDLTDDGLDEMVESVIDEHIEAITRVCATYPEGTIIERRWHLVTARSIPFAA